MRALVTRTPAPVRFRMGLRTLGQLIVICYGCAGSKTEPDGKTPCYRCGGTGIDPNPN